MPKRKEVSVSGKNTNKKLKTSQGSSNSQLSYDSPRQCFQSLIYPTTVEEFFEIYWEKQVGHFKRNNPAYYGELFTKSRIESLVKKEKFEYDVDIFVSRYTKEDDQQDIVTEEEVTMKNFNKYFKDKKSTILLSKPNRFSKELHKMLEMIEIFFGSCAFAHVEINPAESQGHAPSYSDKEVFVLQLEGKKRWQMFKTIKELPIEESDDLNEDELGEVINEYIAEPGDLLYFPRGTVLQAISLADGHSTDISIEISNENYWGNFISNIVDKAVAQAVEDDISFRQQLPVGYQNYMGFAKKEQNKEVEKGKNDEKQEGKGNAVVPKINKNDSDKQKVFNEKLQSMLQSLLKYCDAHWGADRLGTWFMGNRLPPCNNEEKQNDDEDEPPNDANVIELLHREHIRIIHHSAGDGIIEDLNSENDEENESEEESEDDIEEEMEEDDKTQKDKGKGGKKRSKEEQNAKKTKKGSVSKNEKSKNESGKSKSDNKKAKNNDESSDEGMDEIQEIETSDEPSIILQHTLKNTLDDDTETLIPSYLKFPVHYSDALLILYRSTEPVAVKDLPLIADERSDLVVNLWAEGLLKIQGQ